MAAHDGASPPSAMDPIIIRHQGIYCLTEQGGL